jgi:hypothetical protein
MEETMIIQHPHFKMKKTDWAFDASERIRQRNLRPEPYVDGEAGFFMALNGKLEKLAVARKDARDIALRVIKMVATRGRRREQQQLVLEELIETLNMAWLGGQHNSSHSMRQKPLGIAGNGKAPHKVQHIYNKRMCKAVPRKRRRK